MYKLPNKDGQFLIAVVVRNQGLDRWKICIVKKKVPVVLKSARTKLDSMAQLIEGYNILSFIRFGFTYDGNIPRLENPGVLIKYCSSSVKEADHSGRDSHSDAESYSPERLYGLEREFSGKAPSRVPVEVPSSVNFDNHGLRLASFMYGFLQTFELPQGP
ncbi:hypothetical protein L218DRAFT_951340 [Marasmius fiardii PR-910]|nr:hypothetical protein L218DRAFT_951340 [Marasmius fiardii PR-910]